MKTKTILLGVAGSIAAYKAAEIASQLVKRGFVVHVVMTASAAKLVTPITFQTLTRRPVVTGLFQEEAEMSPAHISLADAADLLLIAPATANIIAKLAHGLADDALSTVALATRAPVLVAPAMNGKMWEHPATRENVAILKKRGVHFIGPEKGRLACGYEGVGRLWNPDGIVERAAKLAA
ncbi:MAG: flavoprotein [Verrucomicrobiae bacterium]|nr:flavoprotein [Verrucomicrobiae bacterium]